MSEELKGINKIKRVLELQEQGKTQEEIAIAVGHEGKDPARALRNFMRDWGYRAVDTKFPAEPNGEVKIKSQGTIKKKSNTSSSNKKVIQNEDRASNSKSLEVKEGNTNNTNEAREMQLESNTFTKEQYEKLLKLVENYDSIMSNTSSNTTKYTSSNTNFELTPATYPIGVTIKVDGETWKKFKKYCKASDEKQQDLITTALNMLMKAGI